MGKTQLDYMEYANDAAAQAAYVSSDGYGIDVLVGGTATASDEIAGYKASKAVDNDDTGTMWAAGNVGYPVWWKYDLGVAITKTVRRLRFKSHADRVKDFTLAGSNNDSDWDDIYTGQHTEVTQWENFDFANATAYRYYRITITTQWGAGQETNIYEIEMLELGSDSGNLSSHSESTIKEQGDYSLKGIAQETGSLNDTLIRTVDPTIDLTDLTQIKFDIRASRTGSNIKISIHDAGGTTTEHTANIAQANVWQTETWDISGVSNANKDAIDSIIITIINADADNIFYIDNMYAEIHIYVGTGSFAYSGSAIIIIGFTYVGSGELTYLGSGICQYEIPDWEYVGSGELAYSGEATQSHTKDFLYDTSGNFVFSGAGIYPIGFAYTGSGSLTYSGEAIQTYKFDYLYEGSGVFSYSGEAVLRWGDWTKIGKGESNWRKVGKLKNGWEEIDKL